MTRDQLAAQYNAALRRGDHDAADRIAEQILTETARRTVQQDRYVERCIGKPNPNT